MSSKQERELIAEKDRGPVSPPRAFVLELTNHCNLRCVMCNFHGASVTKRRDKGFMSSDLAARLLEEISEWSGNTRPWVALHGAGESLLHKEFVSILGSASHHSNLNAGFLTNAMLLDRRLSEEILGTGLSWIGFSIDGIDDRKFNRYRRGGDYKLVLKNTLDFIDLANRLRPDLYVSVNMTLQEDMESDVSEFVEFWIRRVNSVCVSPVRPVGSRINKLARLRTPVDRIQCYMLHEMMVVSWNGKVPLCCEDWFSEWTLGDASSSSLRRIWEGEGYRSARLLHERGEFSKMPLCSSCNSWYNALPESRFDEKLGCMVTKTAWQYEYRGQR